MISAVGSLPDIDMAGMVNENFYASSPGPSPPLAAVQQMRAGGGALTLSGPVTIRSRLSARQGRALAVRRPASLCDTRILPHGPAL
jgi:hypothetical protein